MINSLNKIMVVSSIAISILLSGCGNSESEKDVTQLKGNDSPSLEERIAANMPKEVDGLAEQYRTNPPPPSSGMDFNSVIAMSSANQNMPEAPNPANTQYNNTVSENTSHADDSEYQANLNKSMNQNNANTNINNQNYNTINNNNMDNNSNINPNNQPPPGEVNPVLDPNV